MGKGLSTELVESTWWSACSTCVSPKGAKFLSTADKMDGTPLVLQLTAEMTDQEAHGNSQHKEGGLNTLTTLESERFSEDDLKLYKMLLVVRMKLAQDVGTAPYAICGDQTLRNFAKMRPSTGARPANIDGVNQHVISCYSGIFIQNITQLSKELNLPVDNPSAVEDIAAVPKPVGNNLPRSLGDANFTSWELWQDMELSFQKIAHFRRAVPIKEQMVISHILDAAQDGFEMNWNRFCEEVGLTLEIASQIRLAIAKVGSRDKLKPIKEELPENVKESTLILKVDLACETCHKKIQKVLCKLQVKENNRSIAFDSKNMHGHHRWPPSSRTSSPTS